MEIPGGFRFRFHGRDCSASGRAARSVLLIAALSFAGWAGPAMAAKKKPPPEKPAPAAAATASPWISTANVQLRLVSANTALTKPDGSAELGLHVRLEPVNVTVLVITTHQ